MLLRIIYLKCAYDCHDSTIFILGPCIHDTITVNKGTDVYIDGGDDNDKITVDWNKTKGNVTLVADKGTIKCSCL